ncbi:hypothetical protein [Roseofilum sp. Guam]|uniref:hypothetical protein n=1 Tax=Roseofilum sp. Guam TaxID=2821502 RepID=UPI001B1140CA|nr:hypothetical protein [Roseofilum sp. Guam]MBP0030319.1 hypothetical protein [Roseofilum sp. Guam]
MDITQRQLIKTLAFVGGIGTVLTMQGCKSNRPTFDFDVVTVNATPRLLQEV